MYKPQEGSVTFRGQTFRHRTAARWPDGIARTFQNLALFRGMNVIDNLMTGRNLRIKSNLFMQALRIGPAEREEVAHREKVEHIIDFLEPGTPQNRCRPVAYGLQNG